MDIDLIRARLAANPNDAPAEAIAAPARSDDAAGPDRRRHSSPAAVLVPIVTRRRPGCPADQADLAPQAPCRPGRLPRRPDRPGGRLPGSRRAARGQRGDRSALDGRRADRAVAGLRDRHRVPHHAGAGHDPGRAPAPPEPARGGGDLHPAAERAARPGRPRAPPRRVPRPQPRVLGLAACATTISGARRRRSSSIWPHRLRAEERAAA